MPNPRYGDSKSVLILQLYGENRGYRIWFMSCETYMGMLLCLADFETSTNRKFWLAEYLLLMDVGNRAAVILAPFLSRTRHGFTDSSAPTGVMFEVAATHLRDSFRREGREDGANESWNGVIQSLQIVDRFEHNA